MSKLLIGVIIGLAAFLMNIPMGYWRSIVKKYSVQWFLAIHLAVPVIFLLRMKAGLGYVYIPGLILFAVAGQILGGRLDGNLG